MPLVSVIIPSYNYGRFVRDAVDSALAQTYRPIEIIVVDDGSKDNTPEVMQAYVGNPLVRYIRQENKGLPGARNTGIRAASGKYIALLDADDVWEPQKLEVQVAFYEQHPEAAIVATGSYEFTETRGQRSAVSDQPSVISALQVSGFRFAENRVSPVARLHPSSVATTDSGVCVPASSAPSNSAIPHPSSFTSYSLRDLTQFSRFRPSSVMMRKDLCEVAGLFDEQMKYVEDLDMWVRMVTHGRVYRLDALLTGFRLHPAVQSMHPAPNLKYHQQVLDKLFSTIPELKQHPQWKRQAAAQMYVHVSWMRYHDGDRMGAIGDTLRSVAQWPLALEGPNHQRLRWKRTKLLYRYAL